MSKEQIDFLTRTQLVGLNAFVFQHSYGSFSSSTTQSIDQEPNRTALTYTTTDLAGGGMILSGSPPTADILIASSGNYRVITSVQLSKDGGGNGDAYVWFSIDGTPVPNSATKTHIQASTEVVMTVEVLLPLIAGQVVSVEANASTTGIQALAEVSSAPRPAVPSIITVVQRIT
jgi:hypothetical protein